jgi:hypothetical protein
MKLSRLPRGMDFSSPLAPESPSLARRNSLIELQLRRSHDALKKVVNKVNE